MEAPSKNRNDFLDLNKRSLKRGKQYHFDHKKVSKVFKLLVNSSGFVNFFSQHQQQLPKTSPIGLSKKEKGNNISKKGRKMEKVGEDNKGL